MRRVISFLMLIFLFLGIFSDRLPIETLSVELVGYDKQDDRYLGHYTSSKGSVSVYSDDVPQNDEIYRVRYMREWSCSQDVAVREARSVLLFYSLIFLVILLTVLKNGV